MKKIILASSSPYRKALLKRLGIQFDAISPNIDEDAIKAQITNPVELAEKLSVLKAQAIADIHPNSIIIGSDQLAHLEGKVLGKGKTLEKSAEQLAFMSGKTHELITSFTVINSNKIETKTNITRLTMRELSSEQIKKYLRTDNPFDCAGSYKLELNGISLFSKIETEDHSAIIGLPLIELGNLLNNIGIAIPTS